MLETLRKCHPSNLLADPKLMRRLNGWLTVVWIAAIPVSYEMHWLSSVTYVSALSIWALVTGHLSTWQAARVEEHQRRDANVEDALAAIVELRAEVNGKHRSHEDGS